ncbi:MAG TPA: hypothetical protein VGO47_05955, partial [Chlamydiales bacterium]|nr:hypothetical protein [Chlamydiales bacterium]
MLFLTLTGLKRYVKGEIPMPGDDEPRAKGNWRANNDMVIGILTSSVEESEWQHLKTDSGSQACWTTLEERHKNQGAISQVHLLRDALTTVIPHGDSLTTASNEIWLNINWAYEMGEITKDTLLCIAHLGALREHPHVESIVARDLAASTPSNPFTFVKLRSYIESEERLRCSKQRSTTESSVALLSKPQRQGATLHCSNCKKDYHTAEFCIAPGGGMTGKTIEDSRRARREKFKSKTSSTQSAGSHVPKGKNQVKVNSADGRAYLVNSFSLTPCEEPGLLPSDTIPTSPRANLCDLETEEFNGWIAIEGEPTTSINWKDNTNNTLPIALNASEITPLSQRSRTAIDTTENPFWVDTGASVHISPNKNDFISLYPIPPKLVGGLSATSVTAIGIGDVKLRIGRGAFILLKNVLYIPDSRVRLISVRCLTRDSNVTAHFTDSECWLTHNSTGTVLVRGLLTPNKNLYSLRLSSTHAEHAFVTQSTPDLHTWHRRLGHTNYQAISEMVKNGLI